MSSPNIDNDAKKQKTISGLYESAAPPLLPSGNVKTMFFKFPKLAGLPHGKEHFIDIVSKCHGYDWQLRLYPGGDASSSGDFPSLYFGLCTPGCIVTTSQSIRFGQISFPATEAKHFESGEFDHWSLVPPFLRCLDSEGALAIEVDIDIHIPRRETWYPNIIKDAPLWSGLYDEQDEANVEFDVQGKIFRLHKVALKVQAPGLYEYFEEEAEGKGRVSIMDIDNDTFAVIQQYIYTVLDVEAAEPWDSLQKTRSILVAADMLGCISLKLYAESVIVNKFLMPDTCAALFVMADSYSCPLLLEAAKDMYKSHSLAVLGSDDWNSLMADCPKLLSKMLYACSVACSSYKEDKIETWDIPTLRKNLQEAELDLDGSKEMLVKRWKDHHQQLFPFHLTSLNIMISEPCLGFNAALARAQG